MLDDLEYVFKKESQGKFTFRVQIWMTYILVTISYISTFKVKHEQQKMRDNILVSLPQFSFVKFK